MQQHMALTGSDLLAKVKELGDTYKSDLVRVAGYVSSKKDGGEQLNFTAFHEALLEAKGVSLGKNDGKVNSQSPFFICLDTFQQRHSPEPPPCSHLLR